MKNLHLLTKYFFLSTLFYLTSCDTHVIADNDERPTVNQEIPDNKPMNTQSLKLSQIDTTPVVKNAPKTSSTMLESLAKLMFSNQLLSGQNIGNSNHLLEQNYNASITELKEETGKTPAIISVDYVWEVAVDDYTETNRLLTSHLQENGIVLVSIHPGNPFLGGGIYEKGTGEYKFEDLFTPNTPPYIFWHEMLEKVADGLAQLNKENQTILWRPLHEMNGDWFWWSSGDNERITSEEYKRLWISIYEYFEKRNLNNLLWVYSPNSSHDSYTTIDVLTLYPGKELVDIVAIDYYEDNLDELNINGSIDKLLTLKKPFGFAEYGQQKRKKINNLDIIDVVKKRIPHTAFVIHWHTNTDKFWPVPRSLVDNLYPEAYLNHELVITRDEL